MTRARTLPFEYLIRGAALEYLDGSNHAQAVEQRDAELEDYLATKAARDATAAASHALGIVADSTFVFGDNVALTDGAALTNPLTLTTTTGRRYRIWFGLRAINNGVTNTPRVSFTDNGAMLTDRYMILIGGAGFNHFETQVPVSGDGAAHNYVAIWNGAAGSVGYSSGGYWYIEDVGPVRP